MLQSPDSSIIKLASAMVGGYNISKWPLTFRVLLVTEPSWTHSYNGGNSVIVKQIKETLNITYASRSLNYITNYIQSKDEVYSLEDIKLAQELVRRIPEMKKWISRLQPFYLDTMPFVPDEYKN